MKVGVSLDRVSCSGSVTTAVGATGKHRAGQRCRGARARPEKRLLAPLVPRHLLRAGAARPAQRQVRLDRQWLDAWDLFQLMRTRMPETTNGRPANSMIQTLFRPAVT